MGLDLPSLRNRLHRRGASQAVEEPMGLGKIGEWSPIVGVRVAGVDTPFSDALGKRVPVSRGHLDRRGLFAHHGSRYLRFG